MAETRDLLAQMMARRQAGLPPNLGNWQPGPTSPFGGLEAFDWKSGQPQTIGTVGMGPSEDDLKLLHILGRRRMPPELSGVGGP